MCIHFLFFSKRFIVLIKIKMEFTAMQTLNLSDKNDNSTQLTPNETIHLLSSNYGLTLTEIEITVYILRGNDRADILEIMDICEGTLKNHMKSIYSKTIELDHEQPTPDRGKLEKYIIFLMNLRE